MGPSARPRRAPPTLPPVGSGHRRPALQEGAPVAHHTGLVGREEELRVLARHLDHVLAGGAAAALVVGEPGIGKTELLAEVGAIAATQHLPVLAVTCVPLTTPMPLEPIAALLGLEDAEHPVTAAPARHERFTDALRALRRRAGHGPLVLQVDDLHWADHETISFLRYVLRRDRDLPVFWLLASRAGEQAELLADDLRRVPASSELHLGGLAIEDLTTLTRRIDPERDLSDQVIATLHERNNGNPFLVTELLRSVAGRDTTEVEAAMPRSVLESVAVRRRTLAPATDEVLRWCAVLPEPIPTDWLVALEGEQVQEAIVELVREGFLTPERDGTVAVAHDLVRDAVAASMLSPERRRRHGRAREAIDELEPLQEDLRGAAAAEALLARAHVRNREGRTAEALRLAESAASLAHAGDGPADEALYVRCLVHLGLIRGLADSAEAGLRILEQAIDLAQQHDMPIEEGQAWLSRSFLTQHVGDEEAYERFARRGLEVASLTPALEAMLLANAAQGPVRRGQLADAIEELERAVEIASRAGTAARDRVAVTLVHALARSGDLTRADALLDGIDVPPDSWEGTRVTYARAIVAEERGEDDRARALYAAGSDDRHNPSTVWSLAGLLRTCCRLADLADALEALERLDELSDRWPITSWLVVASHGSVAVASGELDRGAALLEEAAAQRDDVWFRWRFEAAAAIARHDAEAVDTAIAALEAMGARPAVDRARQQAAAVGLELPEAADPGLWQVGILGAFTLHRDGAPVALPTGHLRALVALLAAVGPQRTERIVDLLWPDATEADGRRRLRQVRYRLRRSAPGLVARGADDHLQLGPAVRCDLRRFEELVARARSVPGDDAREAATQADALVRGDVAADVRFPGDDELLEPIRAWVTTAHQRLLHSLASTAERDGDGAAALAWRQRAVDIDPHNVVAVERLVAALRHQGRAADADALVASTAVRFGTEAGPGRTTER